MMTLILTAGLCVSCSKEEIENNDLSTKNKTYQVEEQSSSAIRENNDIELNDKLEMDFTHDYSEDIQADSL